MEASTMHTYRKNENLDNDRTINSISTFICSSVRMNYKHEKISSDTHLDIIRNGNYVAIPQINGMRCWIVFTIIKKVYYAVYCRKGSVIDKLFPIDLTFSIETYHGTIFEGVVHTYGPDKLIVIDEIYMLCGQVEVDDKIGRINKIGTYISTNMVSPFTRVEKSGPRMKIVPAKYFLLQEDSLINMYNEIKKDDDITSLIFFPNELGTIFIHPISDSDLDDVETCNFFLRKMKTPDEYLLYENLDNKYIDRASIPDLETSKRCKLWFEKRNNDFLFVKCVKKNRKWVPIEIVR